MRASVQRTPPAELPPATAAGHAVFVKEALVRNISRDVPARVGYLLTRILIPPFVVARIGLSAYSVWSAIFILVSYVGISTMGISAVYVKYTAEFSARGEIDKANSLLSTGLFGTGLVCTLIFVLTSLKMHSVLIWLGVTGPLMGQAHAAVLMVIGVFLCGLSFGVFGQALAGSHKIAETQTVWVVSYLAEMLLIFYLVGTGHGLMGLAEAFAVRTLISIILNVFAALKLLPWLRISPLRCSVESLRKLVGFGGVVQLSALLTIALSTIERVIAAPLIGLNAVGIMDLSDKWPSTSSLIPDAFAYSFLPAASYLKGGRDHERSTDNPAVPELYLRGARYMHLASSSVCALLAAASGPLLMVWLGTAHSASAYLMTIFAIQQNVHHMTGPGTSILKGIGRPKEELYHIVPSLFLALIIMPLSRLVLGHWSIWGLGTSVVIATIAAAIFFIAHANRILGVSWLSYLQTVIIPGSMPYLIALFTALPAWRLFDHHLTRWHEAAIMLGVAAFYAVALMIAIDRLVFDAAERRWFRSIIRRESEHFFGTPLWFGESNERSA
jgi:O-antigen/teichoic acid export membrane protein